MANRGSGGPKLHHVIGDLARRSISGHTMRRLIAALARSATSAATSVLPDPMKPSSASGRREWLDAAGVGRYRSRGRHRRDPAAAPLLRLDEDLVAEITWLR